ncbi:MAG: TonB-dependent siderophore receptor precursor, partial [Cereibacter sp.]|nr:TonB-dependent siderophore receptor precursor [Cereibacter sp.]
SGTEITRGANYQRENTTGLSLDSRLTGEVLTGGMEHKLLFGLDLRKYDADTVTEFYNATGGVTNLDWRDPVYGGVPTGAPWYISKPDVTQTQIGLYAQDEITAGRWRGSIALRHDWSKQEGTTYTNFAGEGEIDQTDKALSGRAGLGYEIAPGALVYANYSTSFDPEIGVDGAGEQLEPTTGKQWELGVKYQPESFNALFTAAIYDLRQENLTVNLGGAEGRRQVGEVKSSGLELGAVGELEPGLNLRASYAYNDTEQVDPSDANDGNEMPNAPSHLASLWLDKAFDNGVSLGGGIRYIGERKGDLANLYSLESVTLLDLAVGYSRENMEASINLNNLSDEVYLANCGSFGCYYGEGRTISAKISYKW